MSAYDAIAGDYHSAERGLTNRFSGGKETYSFIIKEAGDNELWTPAAGRELTLYWISLNTPEANTEEVLAVVKLAPWEPYGWYLGAPGGFMHWEVIAGEVGAKLMVNLSVAQTVIVNFTITEGPPRNE